jgi:hypothetical protein
MEVLEEIRHWLEQEQVATNWLEVEPVEGLLMMHASVRKLTLGEKPWVEGQWTFSRD